jgi:hypothetical protein
LLEFLSDAMSWRNCSLLPGARLVTIGRNELAERFKCECVTAAPAQFPPTVIKVISYMLG